MTLTRSCGSGSARLLDGAAALMVGRRRRSHSGAGNLLDGAGEVVAVRCKRRNDGLARRRCARWWEVCGTVGGVRDLLGVALDVGEDEGLQKCAAAKRRNGVF